MRRSIVITAALAAIAVPLAPGSPSVQAADPVSPYAGLHPYVGSMHEHSGYSDGWVGSTPKTFYESGKRFGLDFMGGSDHSDFLGAPLSTSQYCTDPTDPQTVATCAPGDPDDPADGLRKWQATQEQAQAASTPSFTGFRGFEWTSDWFGHINVYFSKNYANAKTDGGYATSEKAFYDWLTTRPELGGGSDGLATFNHPGAKDAVVLPQPGDLNWHDFAYDPRLDDVMVGMETFNDDDEYDVNGPSAPAGGYYAHVLDKGWHIGPVGAEDLGHRRTDDWGGPSWAKTVILATDRSPAALKAAMRARHFYSVAAQGIRLDYVVDGAAMGSRISRPLGSSLGITGSVTWPGHSGLHLELVTSGGAVVADGTDALSATRAASAGEKYYFLRVREGSRPVAFSAPVWVSAAATAHTGEWLAGDLHVHTCYSHDAYCPRGDSKQQGAQFFHDTGTPLDGTAFGEVFDTVPFEQAGLGDYNTDLAQAYTLGGTPEERFYEASLKGLDYLALTDHHSDGWPHDSGAKSIHDPGFGSHGVVGVPGYENSIRGHAQMLGATHVISAGDQGAADINAMADQLRDEGGLFQANHPADGIGHQMTSCDDTGDLHWHYGYDVRVDSVEVWNTNHLLQPPMPAGAANADALRYWECMLARGWHVTATGGGDSHWLSVAAAQGVGNPTTWVFAPERSSRGVLQGVREGRTSISLQTPASGGTQLLLEGDRDGDGVFESMMGDTVPAGTAMRVRALGTPGAGLVTVRANGSDLLVDQPLAPGGAVTFTAPAPADGKAGWVYASLAAPERVELRKAACDDAANRVLDLFGEGTSYCRDQLLQVAMTSAVYVGGATLSSSATLPVGGLLAIPSAVLARRRRLRP